MIKCRRKKLYTRLSQGDEQAYYEIFDLHWERLYTIAKKIFKRKRKCERRGPRNLSEAVGETKGKQD